MGELACSRYTSGSNQVSVINFQGEYGETDPDLEGEGEYEEEA